MDDDAEVLFSNVFSNKILGVINNESEDSFIEKLVVEAQKKKFVSPEGEDIFALKKRYNIKEVAKTRGEKSVLFETENGVGEIAVKSRKNVSTVGAGDVSHGAFCYFKFSKNESFKEALTHATEIATNYVK